MKNATAVYRCPGPLTWEGMQHEMNIIPASEIEAAQAEGWHLTVYAAHDAMAAAEAPKADDAPIEREEIIRKAEALGIKIDRRWSDARLADEVAKAVDGVE